MTPILPRLVTAGRDHAPAAGRSADDHRPAPVLRMVALFHRGIESIHIDMDNLADGIGHIGKSASWQVLCFLV